MPTTLVRKRIVVVCEDGVNRASRTFESRHEADNFANWGHCCTSRHFIGDLSDPATPAAIERFLTREKP